jgi:prepilin-type N-terminal cleavage/methylation domain-containing protein
MYTALRKSLNKENDKGFTLIELLVVIIIIGILAAIAIPIFLNQRKKATEASMKSDARTIATQMETYFTDSQSYPTTITVSGSDLVVGDEKVRLSPGNDAQVYAPANGPAFCVEVSNAKVTNADASLKKVVYMSDKGGLQLPAVTSCGTTDYGTTGLIAAAASPTPAP